VLRAARDVRMEDVEVVCARKPIATQRHFVSGGGLERYDRANARVAGKPELEAIVAARHGEPIPVLALPAGDGGRRRDTRSQRCRSVAARVDGIRVERLELERLP